MTSERYTLELALAAIDAASKGVRKSDVEDDWQECIVCRGWISHQGHTETCKLIAAGNELRKALAALAPAGDPDRQQPSVVVADRTELLRDISTALEKGWSGGITVAAADLLRRCAVALAARDESAR